MTRRNQKHGLNFETLYRGWKKHRFSNLEKVWVHRKIIITFTFSRDNIGSIGCIEGTREMNCNGLMRLRTLDPWFPFNPGPTLSFIFSFSSYTYTFILLPVHSYIGYKILIGNTGYCFENTGYRFQVCKLRYVMILF